MKIQELADKLSVDSEHVRGAVYANGFNVDEVFTDRQQYLIRLYVDYLVAMDEANEAKHAFKYNDGEEGVDKSKVFEQYRQYAQYAYKVWERDKVAYDNDNAKTVSFFKIRGRAGAIDAGNR